MSKRKQSKTRKRTPKPPKLTRVLPPQQYAHLLNNLTDASFSLDTQWRFTYLSPKAETFLTKLRKKSSSLLGKDIWEEFPEAVELAGFKIFRKVFAEKTPAQFEDYYPPLDTWFEIHAHPTDNGLDVYLFDITRKRKAESALRESEERYRLLVEYSPEAIAVHSEGKLVFVNNAAVNLMRARDAGELIGKPVLSVVHPDYHEMVKERFEQMFKEGKTAPPMEEKFIRLDNSVIDVEVTSFPMMYNGKPGAQVVVRDISERKKTESALRDALHFNEQIISTAGQGIVVYDTEMRHVVWNAFMERLTGITAQEAIGQRAVDIFPNLREQGMYELLLRSITGETTKAEDVFLFFPKTGKSCWVMCTYAPHRNAQGIIIGAIGVISDISEQKRIEETVRKSDERYRAFISQSTEGIYRFEFRKPMPTDLSEEEQIDYIYRYGFHSECNLAMARMYGYSSPQDLIGKPTEEILPRTDPHNIEYLRSFIRSQYRLVDAESHELDKYGKPKYFLNNLAGTVENGLLLHIWGIQRDITERKRAEEAFRLSESKYRQLIEQMNDGLMQVTPDNVILFVNKQLCELVGYAQEELLGKVATDVLTDEAGRNTILPKLKLRQKGISDQYEVQLIKKSGERVWVRINGTPVYDHHGNVVGSIGLHTNITERKIAEEALHKSEDQLRRAQQVGKMGSWYANIEKNTLEWSEQVYRIFGQDRTTFVPTNERFFDSVHPDDRATVLAASEKAMKSGERYAVEHRIILPGGTERWVSEQAEISRNEAGTAIAMIGVVQDITEQKRAAEALRSSEQKFRGLFENVPDGVYQSTPDGKILAANPALVRILGYESEEELRTVGSTAEFYVNPSQRDQFKRILDSTGELRNAELVLKRKDGEIITVLENSRCLKNNRDKILYYEGTLTDITELKRAERALQESEERFRKIFEESPTGIALINTNLQIINVNDALCKSSGYSKHEFTSLTLKDVTHPEDLKLDMELTEKMFRGELPSFQVQNRYFAKSGETIWSNVTSSIIRDDNGKPLYCLRVVENITDQKLAEFALKESERQYRTLIEQSNDAIYLLYDRKFEVVNKKFMELFGVSADEVRSAGFNFLDLVAPESIPLIEERQRMVGRGQEPPLRYEFLARSQEGRLIPVEASVSYISYKGGTAVQGILRDVTERRNAEEGLKQMLSLLQSTLESTADGILLVDRNGKTVTFNQRFSQLWRIPQEVLDRSDDGALASALDQLKNPEAFLAKKRELEAKPEGESFDIIEFKDGRVFERYSIPQRTEGKPVGRVWSFRDITTRLQAEKALRESEEKYRALFEESKDVVFISSVDGRFVDINPAGVDLFGFLSKEEMMHVDIANELYFNQNDRRTFHRMIEQRGFVRDFELTLRRKDGEKLIVLETATAVRNEDGKIIAYRGIIRDITERKRLEDQLRQAQKLQSIGTLAGGIAHDFNNILGIILGYISRLARDKSNVERIEQSISAITKATERGTGLVRQLLTFARQTDVALESVHINALVEEIARIVNETFPKMVTLSLDLAQHLPTIVADSNQLHQALLNLCLNAKDAMPQGGQLLITTQLRDGAQLRHRNSKAQEESYVCISVSDTGTGMDETTLNRIFEPFFTTKRRGAGTGLGLAVVYGIVDSHRGFIDVYSEPGRGTTFRLYLPNPQGEVVQTNGKAEHTANIPGGSETILVVEDEDMLLDLIKSTLEAKGYAVLMARDGVEAVDVYREHHQTIAAVITDLGLPRLGGLESSLEMTSINPLVKVIFASGYLDPNIKADLNKARAKAFIQKPYDTDEVLRRVRDVIDAKG